MRREKATLITTCAKNFTYDLTNFVRFVLQGLEFVYNSGPKMFGIEKLLHLTCQHLFFSPLCIQLNCNNKFNNKF